MQVNQFFSFKEKEKALLDFEKAAFASTKTFKEYAKAQEDISENKRIDIFCTNNYVGAEHNY